MKHRLLVCTTILLSSVSIPAIADPSVALQNICSIVAADDKSELRKKMKSVQSSYNLRLRDYYTGVSCDNQSMLRHAIINNAVEVGTLMVKKMTKDLLNEPEADGKTVTEWASLMTKIDSPIIAEIEERLN